MRWLWIPFLMLMAGACAPPPKPTREQKLAALQKAVEPQKGEIFQQDLAGERIDFLLLDCQLFMLNAEGEEVRRDKVLEADAGFFPSCTAQSHEMEGPYMMVSFSTMAFGAGGSVHRRYRSKDGRKWEARQEGGRWLPR